MHNSKRTSAVRHPGEYIGGVDFLINDQLLRRYSRDACRSTKCRRVTELGILVDVVASNVVALVGQTGEARAMAAQMACLKYLGEDNDDPQGARADELHWTRSPRD